MRKTAIALLFLPLLVWGAPPRSKVVRRPASDALYTVDDFYSETKHELDKSLKKVTQNRVDKNVRLAQILAAAQDPWSFSNAARITEYAIDPTYREYTSTATLKYLNQQGFSFQTYVDMYDNTRFMQNNSLSTRSSHHNLGFSFSQDLFNLFGTTKFEIDQQVTALQGKSRTIAAESTYLSDTLKLIDSTFSLYSAYCKKQELAKIMAMARDTVKISEVQKAARTISTRDQLRIAETYLGYERQLSSNQFEIQSYENFFTTITAEAGKIVKTLSQKKINCGEKFDELQKIQYPKRELTSDIVKFYPSMLNLEISKETLKKQYELLQVQRRPALALSAGADRVNNLEQGPNKPYNDYYVGVTFTYQFKGDQFDAYKQSLIEQGTDLTLSQRQNQLDLTNYITGLYDQVEFQMAQVPLAQKSIEISSQLLRIIQTQQAIGQLDATAIDSAYVAYSQAVEARREIWSTATATALKLREIKKSADRAVTLRAQ